MSTEAPVVAVHGGKYLIFKLGGERFGLPLSRVQEIIGVMPIMPLPRLPAHVRGVINLRGRAIPVIDLRPRLNMAAIKDTASTCVIALQTAPAASDMCTGILADEVLAVLEISTEQIEPPSALGSFNEAEFIVGMSTTEHQKVLLLDSDGVFEPAHLTEMLEQTDATESVIPASH